MAGQLAAASLLRRALKEVRWSRRQQPGCCFPLPVWRIPDERFRSDLASISVTGADNRDIVDSVDRNAPVIRDRIGQRPDLLDFVVDLVHTSSLLRDLFGMTITTCGGEGLFRRQQAPSAILCHQNSPTLGMGCGVTSRSRSKNTSPPPACTGQERTWAA